MIGRPTWHLSFSFNRTDRNRSLVLSQRYLIMQVSQKGWDAIGQWMLGPGGGWLSPLPLRPLSRQGPGSSPWKHRSQPLEPSPLDVSMPTTLKCCIYPPMPRGVGSREPLLSCEPRSAQHGAGEGGREEPAQAACTQRCTLVQLEAPGAADDGN